MIKAIIYKIRKNQYLYFFFRIIIFLIIVFIMDFITGKLLSYFYFKQDAGSLYRTTFSIEKTEADILIFGSSRAVNHYIPEIFESQLNLSCYNAGKGGNFIFYNYAILKGALCRYTPKIIILDIVADEFAKNQDSYDRLSCLLPYYKTHPEIRSVIELKGPFEKYKLFSDIYPYNSLILTIAIGNMEYNKKRKEDFKGFIPLNKNYNQQIKTTKDNFENSIDSVKVKILESFINDCISSKVRIYLVCSPYYIKLNHTASSIKTAQMTAKKYNVPFLDYSQDSIFLNNPLYFADLQHLNKTGAQIFSNMIIDTLLSDKNIHLNPSNNK